MEPTNSYFRAKRNLVFCAVLLLISVTIGIDFSVSAEGNSYFPFKLENDSYFNEVIFGLVAYFTFQISLFWHAQHSQIKDLAQYKIDFWASLLLSAVSLLVYLYLSFGEKILAKIELFLAFDKITHNFLFNQILIINLLPVVLGSVIFFIVFNNIPKFFVERISKKKTKSEAEIIKTLRDNKWNLIFNPVIHKSNSDKGFKKISFSDDGEIKQGKNNNEYWWRVNGKFLEIFNSHDQLFSRFAYDSNNKKFMHTNDEDTLSLRDQRIEKVND